MFRKLLWDGHQMLRKIGFHQIFGFTNKQTNKPTNKHKPENINQEVSEGLTATRARPKSQIFRSQVVFSNKLLGFRSLQRTLTFAFHDMISMDF